MTEQDGIQKFKDALISKYGYPEQSIKTNIKLDSHIFDLVVQKAPYI